MMDLAVQLYTVRDQMTIDTRQCLRQVAGAGFRTVELAGFGTLTATELRAALDDVGLRTVSSHVNYDELEKDLDRVVDQHLELGCSYVIVPDVVSSHFDSADSVKALAAQFNTWGAALVESGLRLGYHGYHDFEREFARYEESTLYDLLVRSTEPELFDIQLDTYWVRYVGDEPAAALHRYAGRVRMLHMKEAAAGGGDTTVGAGTIDWPSVFTAARDTGIEWLVVEQEDDPANAIRDIEVSLTFIRELVDASDGPG